MVNIWVVKASLPTQTVVSGRAFAYTSVWVWREVVQIFKPVDIGNLGRHIEGNQKLFFQYCHGRTSHLPQTIPIMVRPPQ